MRKLSHYSVGLFAKIITDQKYFGKAMGEAGAPLYGKVLDKKCCLSWYRRVLKCNVKSTRAFLSVDIEINEEIWAIIMLASLPKQLVTIVIVRKQTNGGWSDNSPFRDRKHQTSSSLSQDESLDVNV